MEKTLSCFLVNAGFVFIYTPPPPAIYLMRRANCPSVLRCEGHSDSVPLPLCQEPQCPSLASLARCITPQVPACSQRDPRRDCGRTTVGAALSPLHRHRFCRCCHMFCHRLSYTEGKGERCPAVSSWQSAPPHQGMRHSVTHFPRAGFVF